MKKLITISIILQFGIGLFAQDFIFSQFQLTPINLNPALTGVGGSDQIAINYRNQQRRTFTNSKSYSINYDRPFEIGNGHKLGIGARYLYDSGGDGIWKRPLFAASAAFYLHLIEKSGNKHYVVFGMEAGRAKRNWFWSRNGFTDKGEVTYNDFSSGINYKIEMKGGKSLNIGTAVFHLNKPIVSDSDYKYPRRFLVHASIDVGLSGAFVLSPKMLYSSHETFNRYIGGFGLKYKLSNHLFEANVGYRISNGSPNSVFFGPTYFYRNQVGFSLNFEIDGEYSNDFSFDALEGTLIYRLGKNKSTDLPE